MPRLKATTASDRVVKKRKRKQPEGSEDTLPFSVATGGPCTSTTTTIPTKADNGGKKLRRADKTDKAVPSLSRCSSSGSLVTSDIPWPEHFTILGQTHKALNLVFTFCCTRKHLATTFSTIKTAVEGHI